MDVYLLELKQSNPELAAAEARAVGTDVDVTEGVAVCGSLEVQRGLACAHRVNELLGECPPDPDSAVELVEKSSPGFQGSFRVRVARIDGAAIDTEALERRAGAVLHRRGSPVDLEGPDEEFRLVFTQSKCYFCRLVTGTTGFSGREPTRKPFFKPGSMSPMLARALTNIAGGYGGAVLLDPMCGTGGVLVEAGLAGAEVVGTDSQSEMVVGSRRNLREYLDGGWSLGVADAGRLPFRDGAVDCAVTDLPYGRASRVDAGSLDALVRDVLQELRRVVRGRVVVVADRWLDHEAAEAGFGVVDRVEDRVHRSLTRRILVLSPPSRPR